MKIIDAILQIHKILNISFPLYHFSYFTYFNCYTEKLLLVLPNMKYIESLGTICYPSCNIWHIISVESRSWLHKRIFEQDMIGSPKIKKK